MYQFFLRIYIFSFCHVVGTGTTTAVKIPAKLSIGKVRQVACGNSHTLIVSADSNTVFSCGSGDGGKLGHGDTIKQLTPKVCHGQSIH